MTKRQNFSKSTIAARYKLCGGRCEGKLANGDRCNALLKGGDYDGDHDRPDWMGGLPTLENCRILCVALCHPRKTKKDAGDRAKVKRIEAKDCGVPEGQKQKIVARAKPEKAVRDRLPMPERVKDVYGRRISG